MKKHLLLLALFLVSSLAHSIPAKRLKKTITLADGTKVEAVLRGDENVHFYSAGDGRLFQSDSVGKVFRQVSREAVMRRWNDRVQQKNNLRRARAVKRKAAWGAESNHVTGKKKGLVLLVNFTDKKMKYSRDEYDNYFNQTGYNKFNMSGSVHDYFYDCSYGQFDLTFDVIGPINVSRTMSYYGSNDSNGDDRYPATMVGEAVRLANAQVDFSDYDWDDDGEVDQVFVIYAGYGEAQSDIKNTIWPHEFTLSASKSYGDGQGAVVLDGVRIDTYACSSELSGGSGTTIDGIGTACHEFSHCLCLPDMYDTSGGGNFGMDCWDLMDYGSYNGVSGCGTSPAPFTSYERMYCGWLKPIELLDPCYVADMPALTSEPVAYLIRNSGRYNEYYLLENHQQEKWDAYAGGHGMLVLHVDFDADVWESNTVNNTSSRQRMTIIPADNNLSTTISTLAGDPWPGTKKKTELTDTSTPAAKLYVANAMGKKFMGHPITDIKETDGKISFTFDGGSFVDMVQNLEAGDITDQSFTLSWDVAEGAEKYEIELTALEMGEAVPSAEPLLKENFSKFPNNKASDGTIDISSLLDEYMTVKGWNGYKVYDTPSAEAKLGSSKGAGYLVAPSLTSETGSVTVVIGHRQYGTDSNNMCIFLNGSSTPAASFANKAETVYSVAHITVDGNCSLQIGPNSARAYISFVAVYDGKLTDEEALDLAGKPLPMKAPAKRIYESETTSYSFEKLDNAYKYNVRVRGLDSHISGQWSLPLTVELLAEDVDGIHAPGKDTSTPACIWDLQGRRSSLPAKGVYILDGKKVFFK